MLLAAKSNKTYDYSIANSLQEIVMQLNLLSTIPLELRGIIDDQYETVIRLKPQNRFTLWPLIRASIYNFTNDQVIRQATMQYLAYHQCIISNVLLGLSFCHKSNASGPITSETLAEKHLDSSIRFIHKHHEQIDFSWLTGKHIKLWQHCCHMYLLYAHLSEYWRDDVLKYAESQCDPKIFTKKA